MQKRKGHGNTAEEVTSTILPSIIERPDGDDADDNKYDNANALVLPASKDKKLPKKTKEKKPEKVLSKKQKKKLMQIVKRKEKKMNREEVLQELAKHQATLEEINAMQSVSRMQTRKRKDSVRQSDDNNNQEHDEEPDPKKMKFPKPEEVSEEEETQDPNVVAFNPKANENSEESESEEDEEQNKAIAEAIKRAAEGPPKNPPKSSTQSKTSPVKKPEDTEKKPIVPAVYISLERKPEVEQSRSKLPILGEEQAIMEAIRYNDVVIICGETGSGKTTQLPQFLYEGGYVQGKRGICITEPRRVAAISMSKRVAYEMNLSTKIISYHIRYDNNVTRETKIRFVTDGVLLKEIQQDFILSSYSVVIIDEAHERSVFSDILIGLLSRIVLLRRKRNDPLKLIIMSATLRVDDFAKNTRLFKVPPPVLKIESRQFPVTVHFSKTTPDNFVTAAFTKVCRIHRTKPAGGILVFVTGRNEVLTLVKKLKRTFSTDKVRDAEDDEDDNEALKAMKSHRKRTVRSRKSRPKVMSDLLPKIRLDDFDDKAANFDEEVISDNDISDASEEEDEDFDIPSAREVSEPLHVLPLYSLLPKDKQDAVFKPPPEGHRLCVIATNVAETSLTIPDIKYVVDSGKVKKKVYDKTTGISTFVISWCSKASADQRAGRAGRTSPGHCYRLYSSAVFNNDFLQFAEPEIVSKPIDDLVLQMKCLEITNIINFPFPTSPSIESLTAAEDFLVKMGALDEVKTSVSITGRKATILTQLGHIMAQFPVSPRYARMLSYAYNELLPYVIAIVAGLTVQEIFLNSIPSTNEDSDVNTAQLSEKWKILRRKWSGAGNEHLLGDLTLILKAIGASEYAGGSMSFSVKNGISHKAMSEIHKLRRQLTQEVNRVFSSADEKDDPIIPLSLTPPQDTHCLHLRQVALAGFFDHVARRMDLDSSDSSKKSKKRRLPYQSIQVEAPVFIDSHSVLCDESPEYVVYQEIHETTRMYMRNVVAIDPSWLPLYARHHCNLSDPLEDPIPFYDSDRDTVMCYVTGTFGPHAWPIPVTVIEFPETPERYKWFARFLLEGTITPCLSEFISSMLSSPKILQKSWIHLQPKLLAIANVLQAARISTLEGLRKKRQDNKEFLLLQILEWVPVAIHFDVTEKWKSWE